jgi:dTMP kinase
MGCFITFEGIEGCGKTTQLDMLKRTLSHLSVLCLFTAEPGGTPLGLKIREILLNSSSLAISGPAELLLFSAVRFQHMQDVVIPALDAGKIVFCDRFTDATIAYQGYGRKIGLSFIEMINSFAALGRKPDLTILFDVPPEVSLKRAMARISRKSNRQSAEDRFEREDLAFHQAVRDGYLILAKKDPQRIRIVNANRAIEAIHREVLDILKPFLDRARLETPGCQESF